MEVFIPEQGITAMAVGTDDVFTALVSKETGQHIALGIFPR